MYTWFDALLVTVLAIMTALGARRELIGLVWGVAAVLICLLVNALAPNPALAALLALLLSGTVAFFCVRMLPTTYPRRWGQIGGGVGGFLLGSVLFGALALSFPLGEGAKGTPGFYPSTQLPSLFHKGVTESVIKDELSGIWKDGHPLQTLLVPDQTR